MTNKCRMYECDFKSNKGHFEDCRFYEKHRCNFIKWRKEVKDFDDLFKANIRKINKKEK